MPLLLNAALFTGLPRLTYDFGLLADLALRASVAKINERSLTYKLYGASNLSVKQVTPNALSSIKFVGFNTYDLMLNFGLRETVCLKRQLRFPDRCPSSLRRFKSVRCSSYVRVSGEVISLRGLSCGPRAASSSSSSESSSEENI
ncbi:hypothetical protein NFI96_018471, partial [Prochilodus magdalenae]